MDINYHPNPILSQPSVLKTHAVVTVFNIVADGACTAMSESCSPDTDWETTQTQLLAIVHSLLPIATRAYGIYMSKQNATKWAMAFAEFITENCYGEKAFRFPYKLNTFHFPAGVQLFGISNIPPKLFTSMAENFHANLMTPDRYMYLTNDPTVEEES